jgi:histidine triad (HIT) family protein
MACIFCRIVAGEIPAEIVAHEPEVVAFLDVQPLADGHVLVVPRAHVAQVEDLEPAAADALFRAVVRLAGPVRTALGAAGTTIGINNGDATGQTIPHVHVHIVPRTEGDGAGSIHTIFPRRTSRTLPDVGAAIRQRLSVARSSRTGA